MSKVIIFLEVVKYAISSIGLNFISKKVFNTPIPPGEAKSLLQKILDNPLTPYASALFIQRPGLLITPAARTGKAIIGAAEKTTDALWREQQHTKTGRIESLSRLSDVVGSSIDQLLILGAKEPRVVLLFCVGTYMSYIMLEPIIDRWMQDRQLKLLERRVLKKIRQEELMRNLYKENSNPLITAKSLENDLDFIRRKK